MKHIKKFENYKLDELVHSDIPLGYDVEKSELKDFLEEIENELNYDEEPDNIIRKLSEYKKDHPGVEEMEEWIEFIDNWHSDLGYSLDLNEFLEELEVELKSGKKPFDITKKVAEYKMFHPEVTRSKVWMNFLKKWHISLNNFR